MLMKIPTAVTWTHVLLSENELATERVRGCKEANVPCLPLCPLASTLSATSTLLTSTSTTNTSLLASNLSFSTLHTMLLAQLSNQIIALTITLLPSSGQPLVDCLMDNIQLNLFIFGFPLSSWVTCYHNITT